jgi:DNA polymerase-3 subunit alpha
MAFGTLRDFEGDIDLVFFSKVWSECRDILTLDEFTALKGSIDPANDRNPQKPSLKVTGIADIAALTRSAARKAAAGEAPQVPAALPEDLAAAATPAANVPAATTTAAAPQAIHVRLDSAAANRDEDIYPLRNYILANPGPCPVFIHVTGGGSEKKIRVTAGISLEAQFENCAGVVETWKE